MSIMEEHDIDCPYCGKEQRVSIWKSINVDIDPNLRERLFDGNLNMFGCEECGEEVFADGPFLYHDMSRGFSVQYLPEAMLEDPAAFHLFTTDGKLKLDGAVSMAKSNYLFEPHVVFHMSEMLRYVAFRELLYSRDYDQASATLSDADDAAS